MGLFGMSKKEKAAIASTGYEIVTSKSRESIIAAINKEFRSHYETKGPGELNLLAKPTSVSDLQYVISATINQSSGESHLRLWVSESNYPVYEVLYDRMKKIDKELSK